MNRPHTPDEARQLLAEAIAKDLPSIPVPIPVSDWVVMSCLQKAIRRAREDLAFRAAATLLERAPVRLWRRCAGIAFEDIGIADLTTVSLVMAALSGKSFRNQIGGDLAVARFIVTAMCRAPKCRAGDDLLMISETHPRYERARSAFVAMPTSDLLQIASGSDLVAIRAVAASYVAGTGWWNTRHLHPRRGEPSRLFEHFLDRGYPPVVVDLAREGFRKGAGILAPLVVMLTPLHGAPFNLEVDQLPVEAMIADGLPGWALDIYSREGRVSLQKFLDGDNTTATWVRSHLPPSQRLRFVGSILFRAEGGLVGKRLRWDLGDELRTTMDLECHGPHCPDATEVLRLMGEDVPLLNAVRAKLDLGILR